MDTSNHDINNLFSQLGLKNTNDAVEEFITRHAPLAADIALHEAEFWTPSQSSFLKEAFCDDSDWVEVVDELDARLRH